MATVDMFLKLETIDGESTDAKHKDELDVLSFHWGIDQLGTALSSGKAQAEDLVVETLYSRASPKLMLACCTGEHIPTAVLTLRKVGQDQQEFLAYKLYDLLVSAYQTTGEGDLPTDQIALNFVKVEIEYKRQNPDGSFGETTSAGFDFGTAKKA